MTRRRKQRRGTIYLLTMSMAMLVGTISFGALMAVRAQARAASGNADFAVARLCARAGLEVALFKIKSDASWRTHLGNGAWFTNVALGSGTYSVSVTDPISGDITLASNHPIVVTCTGAKGSASYSVQVRCLPGPSGVSCLQVGATSGVDTNVFSCQLTGDQTVTANNNFNVNNQCVANANVEYYTGLWFSGTGTCSKGTAKIAQPRVLPDSTHVFDYYKANGTAIPLASLLKSSNTQIVANPSFETNATGWYVASLSGTVTMATSTAQKQDGSSSLLISNRATTSDVPATDLSLSSMRNGDTYAVSLPVFAKATGTVAATLTLVSDTGTQSFSTATVALKNTGSGGWVTPSGNLTISWTGNLTKATLTITITAASASLYIDKISLTDTSLPGGGSGSYIMDRILLSPGSNPYGATNAQGIYVLDCATKNVTIGACRIVGTLVLLNAGSGTVINGPITWEPALPNYPALLSDSPIGISFDANTPLSESTLGINLNPAGTPYPYVGGTTGTAVTDAFPSAISGIVYCAGTLTLTTAPSFHGPVISAGTLNFNGPTATLSYSSNAYFNPPPGFVSSTGTMVPVPGTWQRITH